MSECPNENDCVAALRVEAGIYHVDPESAGPCLHMFDQQSKLSGHLGNKLIYGCLVPNFYFVTSLLVFELALLIYHRISYVVPIDNLSRDPSLFYD